LETVLDNTLIVFIFGIALGVLLTVKPLKEVACEVHEKAPAAFAYIVLGFLMFAATWALGWVGFTVVITTLVIYHTIGRGKIPLPTIGWAARWRSQPPEETVPQKTPDHPHPAAHNSEDDVPPEAQTIEEATGGRLDGATGEMPDHSSNQQLPTGDVPPGQ
jgi:hypothetical protein